MKHSIKKRLTAAMLGLSTVLLLVSGAICAAGAGLLWQTMSNSEQLLGAQAARDSADALERQALDALASSAHDMALLTDEKLLCFDQDVRMLTGLLTELYANAENEALREPDSPKLSAAVLYQAPDAPDTVRAEAPLLLNVSGILRQLAQTAPGVTACYVATQSGLLLMVDQSGSTPDAAFDARTREWYQSCAQTGQLQWTGPFDDALGRGAGMVCSAPFYDEDGVLLGVVGAGLLLEDINRMVLDAKIGKTGYAFVTDRNTEMVLSRDIVNDQSGKLVRPKLSAQSGAGMTNVTADIAAGRQGTARAVLNGEAVFFGYAPLANLPWQMVTVTPVSETLAPALAGRQAIEALAERINEDTMRGLRPVAVIFGAVAVVVAALSGVVGMALSRRITEPIRRLARSVERLQNGLFICDEVFHTGDELEALSLAFCAMTRQLDTHIRSLAQVTAEKERIAAELDVAARIQSGMLPCIFPAFAHIPQIDLYATMTPALEVGGDFYDFFLIGQDRLGVVIADVSGKGVPSALFMVIAKTLLQNHAQLGYPPAQTLEQCNRQLCKSNEAGLFVTVFIGVLELDTGRFSYCCAGHNPPLLLREGRWDWLDTNADFVLAGMPDASFRQMEISLQAGDALFLYTDGVTEAQDAAGAFYSEERLLKRLNTVTSVSSAADITAHVRDDVQIYAQDTPQSDDITMLALVMNRNN